MIRKYTYGCPFLTDAVVEKVQEETGRPVYLEEKQETERILFTYTMKDTDLVYGLGENVRGINKRGWIYESYCTDESHHHENTSALYAAHNFLIIKGDKTFGIFIDYPGKVIFDIGYTHMDQLKIIVEDKDLDLYVIEAQNLREIVREFRMLIGRSYIPPKWAFGYQQSRWGYKNEEDIRKIAAEHRENHLPLDSIYLDIDYMERYKDFTIDKERYKDFSGLVKEMKENHIHLVPIIDAGVKIEPGYFVYEDGVKNGYFCKDADGKDFVAGVWPGKVHFPDFLNPEVRQWFGNQYGLLLDLGIEGFWNDMNEPAIFYAQDRLEQVLEKAGNLQGENLDIEKFFGFQSMVGNLCNNREDHKKFYHETEYGKKRHDKIHNLYGYNMTRAAGEAFERLSPHKRILMFSRSSYIGMHRYGGIWTGDNKSWWQHMLLNLKMLPSLNMTGILYTGADIGGFSQNATEDLMMRWIQLAMFSPLMRNHSEMHSREQEICRFDHVGKFRNFLEIRYGMIPYIYSEFMKAALNYDMYFQPLAFVYPEDDFTQQVEDQLMVGESLMMAPVYEQNATGRYVYLPEEMAMLRFRSLQDYDVEILAKGHHYVVAGLYEMIIFLRPDKILLLGEGGESVQELKADKIKAIAYVREGASYDWYDDDGEGKDYDNPDHYSQIVIDREGNWDYQGKKLREFVIEKL